MKISALRTHYESKNGKLRLSAVDYWRIDNPLSHITDHKVEFHNKIVVGGEQPDIAWEKFKDSDIVWSSYFSTPKHYAYMKAASEAFGFTTIMDIDDNVFEVDKMAPGYVRYYPGSPHMKNIKTILADVDIVTTSTPHLKEVLERFRFKPVYVLPNAIDPVVYHLNPKKIPDNKDKIVIGYQGSSTHYSDLVDTGALYALRRIVNKYDNVYVNFVGCLVDDFKKFLPEDRVVFTSGASDHKKWRKVWQELDFDIGLAPLKPGGFNRAKSNIKYQEYGLRRIPALYSWIDPYIGAVKENKTGFLFNDEEELYEKCCWLVENKKLRTIMGRAARKDVLDNYTITQGVKPWQDLINSLS